jgi:hypothetical protein
MTDLVESIAEKMTDEIGKLVAAVQHSNAAAAPSTIHASLAAIIPSAAHIAQARGHGIEPSAHLSMVRQYVFQMVAALRQFAASMPANDQNTAAVAAIIARLV